MRAMNTIGNRDVQSLLDPMDVLSVVDYGDFYVDNMSSERSIDHITAMVAETSSTKVIPMMVGGDTSIFYSAVNGIARLKEKNPLGLSILVRTLMQNVNQLKPFLIRKQCLN
jgi:guanidinobutyrase